LAEREKSNGFVYLIAHVTSNFEQFSKLCIYPGWPPSPQTKGEVGSRLVHPWIRHRFSLDGGVPVFDRVKRYSWSSTGLLQQELNAFVCILYIGLVLAIVAGIVFGVAFGLAMLIISFIYRLRSKAAHLLSFISVLSYVCSANASSGLCLTRTKTE